MPINVIFGNYLGKTTTMSMISGIISKTSGTISVNGEDDIDRYRHSIGYCPQHNAFMHYFTVKDHLMFFAAVRIVGLCPIFTSFQCTIVSVTWAK